MIIKEPSVESENELRNYANMLIQYMINQNQKRIKHNKAAIEATIWFLSFCDYFDND
jgi:hypothetical protein